MPQRKRRSNRMVDLELATLRKDIREKMLNGFVPLIRFGQESLEWNESVYRSVSLRLALRMCADGEAEKFVVDTPNGGGMFFRELKPVKGALYRSPTTLTLSTMDAVAAQAFGDKMTGGQQRHVDKVLMWPLVGDTKAPCVRARASEKDMAAAESLIRRSCGGNRRRQEIQVAHYELPAAA